MKSVAVEHHPEVNPVPVRTVEPLIPENLPVEQPKESLEPAATSWGICFHRF